MGSGKHKINHAKNNMINISTIKDDKKVLSGVNILGCSHLTKETAVLIETLYLLGANVHWCASNIYSTKDDVVKEIIKNKWGKVKGRRNMTIREFWDNIKDMLIFKNGQGPDIVIDNGITITALFHEKEGKFTEFLSGNVYNELKRIKSSYHENFWKKIRENLKLFVQQTTSGYFFINYLESNNLLIAPVIDINNSITKCKIDNTSGSRQSCINALNNAGINLVGLNVLVVGYGNVGKGVAMGLQNNKAIVTIAEIDPICALQASLEGFKVGKIKDVIGEQDLIITCTGQKHVIDSELILMMKDGAKLGNIGYSSIEIDMKGLETITHKKKKVGEYKNLHHLKNNKEIVVLANGELINLSLAEGHPSHIMSLTFSNIIYAILDYLNNKNKYSKNRVYELDNKSQIQIAREYLDANDIQIDKGLINKPKTYKY
jgi:adenosylhomocysteinase